MADGNHTSGRKVASVSLQLNGQEKWTIAYNAADNALAFYKPGDAMASPTHFFTDTGNIGVGCYPLSRLHVQGHVIVQSQSGEVPHLIFTNYDYSQWKYLRLSDNRLEVINQAYDRYVLACHEDGSVTVHGAFAPARFNVWYNNNEPLLGTAHSLTIRTNAGALGTNAGDVLTVASFGFYSANSSALGIRAIRTSAGNNWESTAILLQMDVDNTPAAGAYIALGANGYVGVGRVDPTARLHVQGDIKAQGKIFPKGEYWGEYIVNGMDAGIGDAGLAFATGTQVRMYITNDGRVGIGTTTPVTGLALHVYGPCRVSNGELQANANPISTTCQLRLVNGNTNSFGFMIRNDGDSTYFLLTSEGDGWGSWTNARPLTIKNSTGRITSLQFADQSPNTVFCTPPSGGMPGFYMLSQSHIPDLSNTYAVVGHNHDDRYYTKAQCDALFAPAGHTHDDIYYRKYEVDNLLQNKADRIHSHTVTLSYTGSHTHGGYVPEDGYHTHTGTAD
jgi:hypothetical protein